MFSVYVTPEGFKTVKMTGQFDLCLRKPRARKRRDNREVIVFEIYEMFSVHTKTKLQRFQIPPV